MEKKMIAFYGNNTVTNDIAMTIAISAARKGVSIAYMELIEGNAHACYQLAAENQRVKTLDYYLMNHKKSVHASNCVLKKPDLLEQLTDKEKAMENHIKNIPDKMSFLVQKPIRESFDISETDYHNSIKRLKDELYEEHDIIMAGIRGNMLSYPVFFGMLESDEVVIVLEDKPEDFRGMNRLLIELDKVKEINAKTIFINSAIDIHESYLKGTKMEDVIAVLNHKALLSIKKGSWAAYSDMSKEIIEVTNKLIGTQGSTSKEAVK